MKKSNISAPFFSDPLLNKAISDIYSELNKLIDKTSLSTPKEKIPVGGMRAVKSIADDAYRIETRVDNGWVSAPAQKALSDKSYFNSPFNVKASNVDIVSKNKIRFVASNEDAIEYDGPDTKIKRDKIDGNPSFLLGSSSTECFKITSTYETGAKGLSSVTLNTLTASNTSDRGEYYFKVDGSTRMHLDDNALTITSDGTISGDIDSLVIKNSAVHDTSMANTRASITFQQKENNAFPANFSNSGKITVGTVGNEWSSTDSERDSYMSFSVALNGVMSEYMKINSGGTVGVGTNKYLTLSDNEIDVSNGDFVLDVAGDIRLNADDGIVDIYDGVAQHFLFDCNDTRMRIFNDTGPPPVDYFEINVGAEGATTIATIDADTAEADLTLDIDGTIILDSEDGLINFKNSGTLYTSINQDRITMMHSIDQSDFFRISIGASGETTLATVDDGASVGHLVLDADGGIVLDSHTGVFRALKAGTEFSPTNSAYAGMILGYTHLAPTSATMYSLSTSMEVIDADAKVTFVAPPSGNVEIGVNYFRDSVSSNKTIWVALSDNATFNQASAELGDGSTAWDLRYTYGGDIADETDDRYNTVKFVAGGLTAGTEYTYWLGFQCSSATVRIRYGGTLVTDPDRFYPPIIMKATALPNSIHTDS